MRRLELDAIKADLEAVNGMLSQRSEDEDPVGWMQFTYRKAELEQQIASIGSVHQPAAAVAVYFGGRPVFGSSGIMASFSAGAVETFQNIVSGRHASATGLLSDMGPIPRRDQSQMMITDVARGSFGFVLESTSDADEENEHSISSTIDEVCVLLQSAADTDEQKFSEAFASENGRVVAQVRDFFCLLDDAGATLRIVDEQRDFALQRTDIELARARVDTLKVDEEQIEVYGRIFFLPGSRRFELFVGAPEHVIRGLVAPHLLKSQDDASDLYGLVGTLQNIKLQVKTVHSQRSTPRKAYTMIGLCEPRPKPESTSVEPDDAW